MRKYATFLLPFAALCLIGTMGIQGLALMVAALASDNIGNGIPLKFFEQVDLPVFSIALPVIGMLILVACLPALRWSKTGEEAHIAEFLVKHPAHHNHEPDEHHLKAA